jgi:gamma-glutamylcyclotransferase (GGCT)/AIG2-like uncharacterized protein YtfP
MKQLYGAYGANTNIDSMARRCPDSTPYHGWESPSDSRALLMNHELVFNRYADVRPRPGAGVELAIWEVTNEDLADLDAFEGYPSFYGRKQVQVRLAGGRPLSVWIYYMQDNQSLAAPSTGYVSMLREGYRDFSMDSGQIDRALAQITRMKNTGKYKYGR